MRVRAGELTKPLIFWNDVPFIETLNGFSENHRSGNQGS